MQISRRKKRTLMSNKFGSMLMGGTLTMAVVSFLFMSDSVIAGLFVGSDAVAGITLATPLFAGYNFFASVLSLGVPIIYSTEMGKFNKEEADRVFGVGLSSCIAGGFLLFVLINLFGDMYFLSCDPTGEVLKEARDYLYWMRFSALVVPLLSLVMAVVYADGDESLVSIANLVQSAGNIVASVLLCRVMGTMGIALATFAFNVISLLILCLHFLKKTNSLRINLYFSFKLLWDVVRFSIIDASTYLFLAVVSAVMNAFVSYRFGPEYLILVSVVALCRELQLLFDGIGEAVTPIFTVYLGEGNTRGIQSIYRIAYKISVIEGALVTLVLFVCAPFIPDILDITDPEMASLATSGVRLLSVGFIFVSLLYLIASYYLLMDKITMGLVVCAMRDLVMSVIMAVCLGALFGTYAMFLGLGLAPAAAYLLVRMALIRRYGRENWPLFITELPDPEKMALFDLELEPEQIMETRERAENMLKEAGYDPRTIARVKLLIEEVYMLIREKNGDRKILSECMIRLLPEGVQIITKDDGEIFDISETDADVTSIASYVVAAYMEKMGRNRQYLTTMSFNRSSFLIRTDREEAKKGEMP